MKIKQVTVENMHKVESATYNLEDTTYLYGPNGSGKSTVLQAIQFCFLGYIPGTGKTGTALFEHSNDKMMKVGVQLQDGDEIVTVTRTLVKSGQKILNEIEVTPERDLEAIVGDLELPILNFSDFLGLTANKQKDLLASVIPSKDILMSTLVYLKKLPEYTDACKDIVAEACEVASEFKTIEDIKEVNAFLKEQASIIKAEGKRITSTAQSMIFYDDYTGETDTSVIQSEIETLMKQKDAAIRAQLSAQNKARYEANLSQYSHLTAETVDTDPKYVARAARYKELGDYITAQQEALNEVRAGQAGLEATFNQNQKVIDSRGICPFIEDNCQTIESKIGELSAINRDLQEAWQNNANLITQAENNIIEARKEQGLISEAMQKLSTEYDTRDALKDVLSQFSAAEDYVDPEIISEKLQKLNDDLVKASANSKYREILETIQEQQEANDAELKFVNAAVKATGENGLQTDVMVQPFMELADIMHQLMVKLHLESLGSPNFKVEAKANSFNFGFMRETFIPFALLSSGEKCVFTVIFMTAISQISNTELEFVMIDDLFDHLDQDRFETVITNVKELAEDTQFIIAGVKELPSEFNDAVEVINLGDNDD